jgi:pyruvate formate lyase activating enzyme
MKGRIHSLETMGMVDGPGIRYVIFLQGCPFRCQYCHNPDTWDPRDGKKMDTEEILADLQSYLPYYRHSGGGLTVSGGEPLLQANFVRELFRLCRDHGIHTTLDTAGSVWNEEVEELLDYTDLVLLDLKEMDAKKHHALTGSFNDSVLRFAKQLAARQIPVWIRHVLVPGLTDDPEGLRQLGAFIRDMGNVEKVEILPFHKMGEYKWQQLGISFRLTTVDPPTEQEIAAAYRYLKEKI